MADMGYTAGSPMLEIGSYQGRSLSDYNITNCPDGTQSTTGICPKVTIATAPSITSVLTTGAGAFATTGLPNPVPGVVAGYNALGQAIDAYGQVVTATKQPPNMNMLLLLGIGLIAVLALSENK